MSSNLRWLIPLGLLAACGNEVALGGPNTLVRTDFEPEGPNCPGGGVAIHTGQDRDGDTYLDEDEITSTQYVCNGDSLVQCAGGTILKGTIDVRSSSDFSQLSGVNCIDGDLLVAGTTVDELPLRDLEVVTGDIVIAGNRSLESLDGLRNLRDVGRKIHIQANDALGDVGALGALRRCGEISIVGNDALVDLVGLESFIHITTQLTITNNGSLRSLSGLDNLTTTTQPVVIRGNRLLGSVEALDKLRSAPLIDISGNNILATASFDALDKVSVRFIMSANESLSSVSLPVLSTVGDFVRFEGDAALMSVSAPVLLSVGGVFFNDDAVLATVDFPGVVFATQSVELVNLPRLATATFDQLASVGGDLRFGSVPVFASVGGFRLLGSVGGDLVVDRTGLKNFNGMPFLDTVSGDFVVTQNSQFSSFAGLTAMDVIGEDLVITSNPALSRSTAEGFASTVTVHGTITIN